MEAHSIASGNFFCHWDKVSTFSATHKAGEAKFKRLKNIAFTLILCRDARVWGTMIDLLMLFFAALRKSLFDHTARQLFGFESAFHASIAARLQATAPLTNVPARR
jgi:hypothetical protein